MVRSNLAIVRLVAVMGFLLSAGLGGFAWMLVTPARHAAQDAEPTRHSFPPGMTGAQLYATFCAACHGEKGDGAGAAARFLYPKPRDFGEAKFRIVTTTNNIPSDDDLKRVIQNGMPGSAMVAFGHLADTEVAAL